MRNSLFVIIVLLACLSCSPPNRQHPHRVKQVRQDSFKENPKALSSTLLYYTAFTVSYNPNTRQPDWVSYTLTAEEVEATKHTPKMPRNFMPDPNLNLPQATNEDYRGSGWVRGHMARRQDMKWSEQAVMECDYFTNICPQNSDMNNGVWHQIENLARKLAVRYDSVQVVCGPVFLSDTPQTIGANKVHIPHLFFKAFLIRKTNSYYTIAFLCPNKEDLASVTDVICSVNTIESLVGLNLFEFLDDREEEIVEDQADFSVFQ